MRALRVPVPVRNPVGGIAGVIASSRWCKQAEFELLHIVLLPDVIFLSQAGKPWACLVQTGISLTVLLETIHFASSFTVPVS